MCIKLLFFFHWWSRLDQTLATPVRAGRDREHFYIPQPPETGSTDSEPAFTPPPSPEEGFADGTPQWKVESQQEHLLQKNERLENLLLQSKQEKPVHDVPSLDQNVKSLDKAALMLQQRLAAERPAFNKEVDEMAEARKASRMEKGRVPAGEGSLPQAEIRAWGMQRSLQGSVSV